MNTRYVLRRMGAAALSLIFVLTLNFVLFRMVKSDPVGSLFRGRNVSQEAKDRLRAEFGLDKSRFQQFVAYVQQTAQGNLGISYSTRQPVASEIRKKIWPTVLLVGVVDDPLGGVRCARRDPRRLAKKQRVRSRVDRHLDDHLRDPGLLPRHPAARVLRVLARLAPDPRDGDPR